MNLTSLKFPILIIISLVLGMAIGTVVPTHLESTSLSNDVQDSQEQSSKFPSPPITSGGVFQRNSMYKMFYGTWEVRDVISGGRFYDEKSLETIIGQTIEYSKSSIAINGTPLDLGQVQYDIAIVPLECRFEFMGAEHYPENEEEIFNLSNEYFVYVSIPGKHLSDTLLLGNIIIKDDQTLVLSTAVGFCILQRVAYGDTPIAPA